MDPCASDTREFVSSWRRDPAAREDELVAAHVQLRSVTRVAKRRASRRQASETDGPDTERGTDVVNDDGGGASSPDGFSDAEERAFRAHHQRLAASPLARVRPLSAYHTRLQPAHTHGNRTAVRARPQSAKVSRRASGIPTPVHDFAWMPTAVKQSKWTEMLQSGPRFQEHNLQRLEAETYALLQQVLRGPATKTTRRQKQDEGQRYDSGIPQKKTKPPASETKKRSAGLAVGSGLQVARSNKKTGTSTSISKTTSSKRPSDRDSIQTKPTRLNSARDASPIDRRAVIEKTKARSKSAARSNKKNEMPTELSEKERKKRVAEAEASANVMREMGWLDDLNLSEQPEDRASEPPKTKKGSKKKKKENTATSSLPTTEKAATMSPHSVGADDRPHADECEFVSTISAELDQDQWPSAQGDETVSATAAVMASPQSADHNAPSQGGTAVSTLAAAFIESIGSDDQEGDLSTDNDEAELLNRKPSELSDPVRSWSELGAALESSEIYDVVAYRAYHEAAISAQRQSPESHSMNNAPEVSPDDVPAVDEHTEAQVDAGDQHQMVSARTTQPGGQVSDALLMHRISDAPGTVEACSVTNASQGSMCVGTDNTNCCSRVDSSVPHTELPSVENLVETHVQHQERIFHPGDDLTSRSLSQGIERGPETRDGHDIDGLFGSKEAHEANATDPNHLPACNCNNAAPQIGEKQREPVVADAYAGEFFDEEAATSDDTDIEGTPKDRQDDFHDAGFSATPCNDDTEDSNVVLCETEDQVSFCSSADNRAAVEPALADASGLIVADHQTCDQLKNDAQSAETTHAAELIQRQYRAFCSRRIIIEQVKFLSRKKRRAERKKSRDAGGRPPAEQTAVDVANTASEQCIMAEPDGSAPTDSSLTGCSDGSSERSDGVVYVGEAKPDESKKLCTPGRLQLDEISEHYEPSERSSPVGVSPDAHAKIEDTRVGIEETEGQQTLRPVDHSTESDRTSVEGDVLAVLLDAVHSEVEITQESTSSLFIQLQDDQVVDTGENEPVSNFVELPSQTIRKVPVISACDQGARNQQLYTTISTATHPDSGTNVTSIPQESANAIMNTCHHDEESKETQDASYCAGACDSDRSLAPHGSAKVVPLESALGQMCEGDSAASISPNAEASDEEGCIQEGLDGKGVDGAEIGLECGDPASIRNACVAERLLEDAMPLSLAGAQPEPEGDEMPGIISPAPGTAHEFYGVHSESLDLDVTDHDDRDVGLAVAAKNDGCWGEAEMCNEVSALETRATHTATILRSHDAAVLHASTLLLRDAAAEPPLLCVGSNRQEMGLSPMSIGVKEVADETRASCAANRIQRTWKEYSTRPTNPLVDGRGECATPEMGSTGDDERSEDQPRTVENVPESACEADISVSPSETNPSLPSILPDEEESVRLSDPLTTDYPTSHQLNATACCEDLLETLHVNQEADTGASGETTVEGIANGVAFASSAVFEHFAVEKDVETSDASSATSHVHVKSLVDEVEVDEASNSIGGHAARCIQQQYRGHVSRRNLLDQLAFFVRQHRRESRKKSRRLSGGLVHRVSADLAADSENANEPTQQTLLDSQVDILSAVTPRVTECASPSHQASDPLEQDASLSPSASTLPDLVAPSIDDLSNAQCEPIVGELADDDGTGDENAMGSPLESSTATTTVAVKSSPTWERYVDTGANKSFYYNPEEQLSHWDRPSDSDVVDRTLEYVAVNQSSDGVGVSDAESVIGDAGSIHSDMRDRWERYKDSMTNKTFYFHPVSQVSQWDRPDDASSVVDPAVATAASQDEERTQRWRHAKEAGATVLESFGGWDRCLCAHSAEVFYYHADRNEFADGDAEPDAFTAAKTQLLLADAEIDGGKARWTLRRNRSLRGDRRGEWQAFVDTETHQTFYYNTVTGESSWDKPVAFMETATASYEWVMYVDDATAQPYYVNLVTNATRWEKPDDFDEAVNAQELSRLHGIREQLEDMAVDVATAVRVLATTEGDEQDEYVISIQDDQDAVEWLAL